MEKLILTVDDSSTIRDQLRDLLEPNGFQILEADSGEAGLALARERQADLMIVDVNMPGMDGLDMIAKVRELPGYKRTPAFVLTTESSADLLKRGRQAGANAWVVKPFQSETLLKGIHKMLDG